MRRNSCSDSKYYGLNDGTDLEFLMKNLEYMDAFLSLTGETEKNILAALAAKETGKKSNCIGGNIEYIPLSQNMGVDIL